MKKNVNAQRFPLPGNPRGWVAAKEELPGLPGAVSAYSEFWRPVTLVYRFPLEGKKRVECHMLLPVNVPAEMLCSLLNDSLREMDSSSGDILP